jgi:hypothetical protein
LPAHTLLLQSDRTLQLRDGAHGPQVVPPQSTSVSSWFWTPSVQVGATHLPLGHDLLAQSLAA